MTAVCGRPTIGFSDRSDAVIASTPRLLAGAIVIALSGPVLILATAACRGELGASPGPAGRSARHAGYLTWMLCGTIVTLLVYAPGGLQSPQPFFGGELLVRSSPSPIALSGSGGFSVLLPSSPAWIGASLMTQGFAVEASGSTLSVVPLNALELVLGY